MSEQKVWILEPESGARRMLFQKVSVYSPDDHIKLLYLNMSKHDQMRNMLLVWMEQFLPQGEEMYEGEGISVSYDAARRTWNFLVENGWKSKLHLNHEAAV